MLRPALIVTILLIASLPSTLFASSHQQVFEAVVSANKQTQPKLQNYTVTIETTRIEEMMTRLTSGIPDDVEKPPTPVMKKFWQRNGKGLVYPEGTSQAPYVEQMALQISGNLAVELNEMLLPESKKDLRDSLLKNADVKLTEVALANSMIQRLEIAFSQPTDLKEAFYVKGMRLPQKQVNALTFDIDTKTDTVRELSIITAGEMNLTVEIRYITVEGGLIPERYQVTSPDGTIDDLFEVQFLEVDGFFLPASMSRKIRRPTLQEELNVQFKDYRVNQPISTEIKNRLQSP